MPLRDETIPWAPLSEQIYRATSGAESFMILEGGSLPRVESYCQLGAHIGVPCGPLAGS